MESQVKNSRKFIGILFIWDSIARDSDCKDPRTNKSAVPGHAGKIEFSGQILSIVIQKLVDFFWKNGKSEIIIRGQKHSM